MENTAKIVQFRLQKIRPLRSIGYLSNELKKRSAFAQNILRVIQTRKLKLAEHLSEMSWEDKRKHIKIVLAGINESGERNGVFIHRKDDKWHYEIRGAISDNIEGIAPMAKHRVMDLLQIEPEDFSNQMNLLSKYQANLVNCVSFRIVSFISYRINTINHLLPNWDHEDNNLNFFREQSRYITLSEARLIKERITGRKYGITAVTKRVMSNNLGIKSGGKMSQWLVDKDEFERFIKRSCCCTCLK